ncbi:MAG: CAP domain-containing protein [Flavihumibacter sp.]
MQRLLFLLFLSMPGIVACKSKPPAKAETPTRAKYGVALSNMEADIVAEVNRYRQSKGLAPLRVNSIIATEAALHSQKMARHQVGFGHDGFKDRVSRINSRLDGSMASGENVAAGTMTARDVVQSWLKSKVHRENIEGRFNLTGVGISRDTRGTIYYTQIFILK